MTRLYPHRTMADLVGALFRAVGAPADEAALTADHLVTSSLMGCDSHGIMRVPEYLDQVAGSGTIVPGAPVVVDRRSGAAALVDCGRNFGPVGATRAMDVAIAIAREFGVACVATHRCNHVARLGAYVEQAAGHGLIAIATCNSPVAGHFVIPWGGKQGPARHESDPHTAASRPAARRSLPTSPPASPPKARSAGIATRARLYRRAGSRTPTDPPRPIPRHSTDRREAASFPWAGRSVTRDSRSDCSSRSSAAPWPGSALPTRA